jgi:hypothetical protein
MLVPDTIRTDLLLSSMKTHLQGKEWNTEVCGLFTLVVQRILRAPLQDWSSLILYFQQRFFLTTPQYLKLITPVIKRRVQELDLFEVQETVKMTSLLTSTTKKSIEKTIYDIGQLVPHVKESFYKEIFEISEINELIRKLTSSIGTAIVKNITSAGGAIFQLIGGESIIGKLSDICMPVFKRVLLETLTCPRDPTFWGNIFKKVYKRMIQKSMSVGEFINDPQKQNVQEIVNHLLEVLQNISEDRRLRAWILKRFREQHEEWEKNTDLSKTLDEWLSEHEPEWSGRKVVSQISEETMLILSKNEVVQDAVSDWFQRQIVKIIEKSKD